MVKPLLFLAFLLLVVAVGVLLVILVPMMLYLVALVEGLAEPMVVQRKVWVAGIYRLKSMGL